MTSRTVRRVSWLIVLVPAIFAALAIADSPAGPVLRNQYQELVFDREDGDLVALRDTTSHHGFVDDGAGATLWTLLPSTAEDEISPTQATQFVWSKVGDGLRLEWSGFPEPFVDLRVIATVTLPIDARESRWHLTVSGLGEHRLMEVHFPQVQAIAEQADEVLAVPVWMGELAHHPREVLPKGRREWEWPGMLSLQCLTLYRDGGPGIYISSDDPSSFRKRFAVTRGPDTLGFEIAHLPETSDSAHDAYDMPYDCLIGAFVGDWFTVAERYREWPWSPDRARSSRLDRGLTSAWVRDAGLWIWNRGRSENVLGPATVMQNTAGMPVNVFWHWWHGCAYDVGFPEYLPPREGTESFTNAMAMAHAEDLHAIIYMNQRLWGMTTESWTSRDAARFAVKGAEGEIRPEVYNTFTKAPCASMCMGTPFWRDTYAGLATEAFHGLHVDGIYMDQACSSLSCYDPAHGHPLGGGTYWIDGFRTLSETIRERCNGIGLAGEGCGEAWLPYLDMMLMLQVSKERYSGPNQWEPIPFFQAVYSGHAVFFGNYSSLTMPPYDELWPKEFAPAEPLTLLDRKFSTQFRLEQARAFAWGQQPTLANFRPEHLESRREEIDFFLALARVRSANMKYLQYGEMLRPPSIDAPNITIPMSRLSIYAGQQEGLKEFEASVPAVLAGAWRADDASIAVTLVNIGDTPQDVTLTLDRATYPLPPDGMILRQRGSERTEVGRIEEGPVRFAATIAPRKVEMYELAPAP